MYYIVSYKCDIGRDPDIIADKYPFGIKRYLSRLYHNIAADSPEDIFSLPPRI